MIMTKICYTIHGEPLQVDDEDYPIVSALKWTHVGKQNGKGGTIMTRITLGRLLQLTELAKRLHEDASTEVDHINGDLRDNRRCNLRLVSRSENAHSKWKRMALNRIRKGVKCSLKCPNLATSLVRLPAKRYLYLCDEHFVTSKQRGQVIGDT